MAVAVLFFSCSLWRVISLRAKVLDEPHFVAAKPCPGLASPVLLSAQERYGAATLLAAAQARSVAEVALLTGAGSVCSPPGAAAPASAGGSDDRTTMGMAAAAPPGTSRESVSCAVVDGRDFFVTVAAPGALHDSDPC